MGRREDRDAIQATWNTYTPRVAGTPITKRDMRDADVKDLLARLAQADHGMRIPPHVWRDLGDDLQRVNPRVRYSRELGVLYEAQ